MSFKIMFSQLLNNTKTITVVLLFSYGIITCQENQNWEYDKISFCRQSAIGSEHVENMSVSLNITNSLYYFELKSDSLNIKEKVINPILDTTKINENGILNFKAYCKLKIKSEFKVNEMRTLTIKNNSGKTINVFNLINNYVIYEIEGLIIYFRKLKN